MEALDGLSSHYSGHREYPLRENRQSMKSGRGSPSRNVGDGCLHNSDPLNEDRM